RKMANRARPRIGASRLRERQGGAGPQVLKRRVWSNFFRYGSSVPHAFQVSAAVSPCDLVFLSTLSAERFVCSILLSGVYSQAKLASYDPRPSSRARGPCDSPVMKHASHKCSSDVQLLLNRSYDLFPAESSLVSGVINFAPPRQTMAFVRAIGRWTMTALVINCIIGGGIFGLPSELTRLLGRASPFAMISAALGMAVIMACGAA